MADATAIDEPLSIPPLSPYIFSDDFTLPDDNDLSFDYEYFGITFDDNNNNHHPSDNNNNQQFFNSTFDQSNPFDLLSSDDSQFINIASDLETVRTDSGLINILEDNKFNQSNSFDLLSSDSQFNNFACDLETICTDSGNYSGNHRSDGSGLINVTSQDVSDRGLAVETMDPMRIMENPVSSHSSGSQNVFGSGFVEETMEPMRVLESENPVSSHGSAGSEPAVICQSPDSGNSVVNEKVLKRKNESCDVNSESRTVKYQKSNETFTATEDADVVDEKDEKKKARLIKNRESAQLSRQRKKHYVEELEDKVRGMQATIHDLNARISFFAAENAALKQQMVAGGGAPPMMYPPHPAMAPIGYPWMPYVVKSQGSQVPLVPIPRLKTPQPASTQKLKKDVKKTEGRSKSKTKKVASISFIGLLLFIVLFGGLVPIMNVKFGGVTVKDGGYPVKVNDYKFYNQQYRGRVLKGGEYLNGTSHNASEPLVASLYVPRNNKLVKIDGDLILYSVMASEKAMALREEQRTTKTEDTSLVVSGDLVPAIPVNIVNRNGGRQPHMYRTSSDYQRALPSNEENLQPKHTDGKLQQWFREGLSGLMLSSGMCIEVFQFDTSMASASGAIVPAMSAVNMTATENIHNSTYMTTVKNRRILPGLPIPLSNSTTNITKEQVAGHDSKHEDGHKHNSVSSMVVSVLVDPREAGDDSDVDGGMMGGGGKGKSFSRIFVVVLLDSVKYVTYSCMLPLKGSSHLTV